MFIIKLRIFDYMKLCLFFLFFVKEKKNNIINICLSSIIKYQKKIIYRKKYRFFSYPLRIMFISKNKYIMVVNDNV
jgi:hypothetical protein